MKSLHPSNDLTQINQDIHRVLESHGIEDPAFVVAFTEKSNNYKCAFWVSNTTRFGSLAILRSLIEKMRAKSN